MKSHRRESSTHRLIYAQAAADADADAAADAVSDARADLQRQDLRRVHRHRRVGLGLHIDGAEGARATAVPGRCATDSDYGLLEEQRLLRLLWLTDSCWSH